MKIKKDLPRIVIVGSGLSGCIVAHSLNSTCNITLIELSNSVSEMQNKVFDLGHPAGFSPHVGSGLGGSTALWSNGLIEIDEEVFQKSWPFPKSELLPWYEAAFLLLGGNREKEERFRQSILKQYKKMGIPADFFQSIYIPAKCHNLWNSLNLRERIKVIFGIAYRFNMEGTLVKSVVLSTDTGTQEIHGDYFILAAGGLSTPILLQVLANDCASPALLNAGKFYEDHPLAFIGNVQIKAPIYRLWKSSIGGDEFRVIPVLRHKGLDITFQLRPASLHLWEDRGLRMQKAIARIHKQRWNPIHWLRLLYYWDDILDIISSKFNIRFPTSRYTIFMMAEQPSHTGSEISGSFDLAHNEYVIKRNWLLTPEYLKCIQEAIDRFIADLGPFVDSITIFPDWPSRLISTAHHSGTARMSATPEGGVCNSDGQVYGIENLFIADGSVIPGSGIANTGLTIAALSLRLADYIQKRIADDTPP